MTGVNPETHVARIKRRNALRQAAKRKTRLTTDQFLAAVVAALEDPDSGLSYRKIAADLGMHHTSLNEMVIEYKQRLARQPQAVDF